MLRSTYLRGSVLLLVVVLARSSVGAPDPATSLDAGYREMYDLNFDAAHSAFRAWEQEHPQDPLGPVSDAAAWLFSEFDRLHILQAELFTDDSKFTHRTKPAADASIKAEFETALAKGEALASQALSKSPQDSNALLRKYWRTDCAATIWP
jgi:hypothetical protein